MDLDKLLESLAAISKALKSPSLQNRISTNQDVLKSIKKFELLVEEIKIQRAQKSFSEEEIILILKDLSSSINEIDEYCDAGLKTFDFAQYIKKFP